MLGRCLRVLRTARRSNQSILKEINISEYAGRTDAEVEAPILWPPDAKSQFIRKDLIWGNMRAGEKGANRDEMVEWYHRLSGHEF